MRKRTKIVGTVGPASRTRDTLAALVRAGVDVFRINFSHGDTEDRSNLLTNIRAVEKALGRPVAVCADLCGPKIRVGMVENGSVPLEVGREIVIQRTPIDGTAERISTTFPELVDIVCVGEHILLADGRLRFEIVRASPPTEFACRILVGGSLESGKGVNLPETRLPISALTEKDREDIAWIAERAFDYVALSFVQRAQDVEELRCLLEQGGSHAQIIAKIEKPQALEQIDAIVRAADAIMVARGDLGVEMDLPSVPITQKTIAYKCQIAGKPCIIATEMLESMIHSPTPTRAEVSDVANAVLDQADAVMLSAESSIGRYPVQAVEAMHRIAVAAEGFADDYVSAERVTPEGSRTTAALAASVRSIMQMQEIRAIVVFTTDGTTARILAKNRPACPIVALSAESAAARRVCIYYGVVPRLVDAPADFDELLQRSDEVVQELGYAKPGDHILVLGGQPIGDPGGTKALVLQPVT